MHPSVTAANVVWESRSQAMENPKVSQLSMCNWYRETYGRVLHVRRIKPVLWHEAAFMHVIEKLAPPGTVIFREVPARPHRECTNAEVPST